jgi:hypothetical protein
MIQLHFSNISSVHDLAGDLGADARAETKTRLLDSS